MKKNAIIILFLFFSSFSVFSQTPEARILSFDGDSFSLIRNGEETVFDLNYEVFREDASALKIKEGDTLSTEDNTFLEIIFSPSGNVIKVSENTYLTFTQMNKNGSGIIDLIYGSIRSKIDNAGNDLFTIRNQTVAAGGGDSDFGFDFTFSEDTQTGAKANVYSFEGDVNVVEVTDADRDPDYSRAVRINGNEQLSIDIENPEKDIKASKVQKIDNKISDYWDENDFENAAASEPIDDILSETADIESDDESGTDNQQETVVAAAEDDSSAGDDTAAVDDSLIETEIEKSEETSEIASITDTDEALEEDETETTVEDSQDDFIDEEELDPAQKKKIAADVITSVGFGLEAAGAIVYALSPLIYEAEQDKLREITLYSMGGVAIAAITALIINGFSSGE